MSLSEANLNNRADIYNKWSFFPRRIGGAYDLVELLDMLWVDSELRGFILSFDDLGLENYLASLSEGENFVVYSIYGSPLLLFVKDRGKFVLMESYRLEIAINDRMICSDESAREEKFGRGFAGLGGNSVTAPRFDI